jgi:lipopolysaccharide export system protein LptA
MSVSGAAIASRWVASPANAPFLAGLAALFATLTAAPFHAQARPPAPAQRANEPCAIEIRGNDSTAVVVTGPAGARYMVLGGGMSATCMGQGNLLLADSAEHFEDRGLLVLYRNVRYTEDGMRLTSDKMTYFTSDERLIAEGRVTALAASGTRFTGPRVEYFRDIPGIRERSRWVATGRPFVRMSPSETAAPGADTTARPGTPVAPARVAGQPPAAGRLDLLDPASARGDSVDLTADIVISENDSLMWASGAVIIERVDMRATADSAMLDNGIEFARLMRDPMIVGHGDRAFTLDGAVIDLWSRDRRLERVLAADSGRVVSDSLMLSADSVDLRLRGQLIERVFAWGGRASADAPAQRIDADSLDILMPGQRLREVRAVGDARATSRADTVKVITEEPDWITGDTIIAQFDTVAVADSSDQPRMREVLASGRARSLYQMAPSGDERGLPNISYNRGRVIKVAFDEGEVRTVDVVDGASGIFLEPAPADTIRAAPAPPAARRP